MNGERKEKGDRREPVTVRLPEDLVATLVEFCRDKRVVPDLVVERALKDYFREGDMSH